MLESTGSRLYGLSLQRHDRRMHILAILIQFALEILRTLLVEAFSARLRGLLLSTRPRGMSGIHARIHRANRNRLMDKLSTEE